MRRTAIILAFLTALCGAELRAQHYIGVRGGWGGGSARFTPVRESKTQWGLYSGGLSYKFYTDTKYVGGVQFDLQYMGRGFAYDELRDGDTSYHRTINSFELPIMWQPHFYIFQRHARVYLNLGVYLNYNMNSKYYIESKRSGIFERGDYTMKLTRDPRWGYGLCGGGGIGVLMGRFELAVEARYYFGYSDVLRNGTKYQGNPTRSQLDNINVSMALYYRLGKGGIRSTPSKGVAARIAEAAEKRALRQLEKAQKKGSDELPAIPLPSPDSTGIGLPAMLAVPPVPEDNAPENPATDKKTENEQ